MPSKRPLARKRQTKINFLPATKSSPQAQPSKTFTLRDSDSDDNDLFSSSRPSKRRKMEMGTKRGMEMGMPVQLNGRGMFGSSDGGSGLSSSSSDEKEVEVVKSKKKKEKKKDKKDKKDKKGKKEKRDKKDKKAEKAKNARKVKDLEESDDEVKVVSTRKARSTDTKKPANPEQESEDEIQAPSTKKSRGMKTRKEPTPKEESEDEIQAPVTKKSSKEKARKEPTPEEESEEEVKIVTPKKPASRKRRREPSPPEDSDEEEEEEVVQSTRKGRRQPAPRPSTPEDESDDEAQSENDEVEVDEQDELKEELAFLQSSPPPDRSRLRSTNGKKPKSDREKALEALKKRRAGTNEPSSSAAKSTPSRKKPVIIDSDAESESELEIIEEEDPDDVANDDEEGSEDEEDNATNAHDIFHETNEDEDFIDDEDEAPLGAPGDSPARIPLVFTGLSTAKPRDLFKYAIEWMVHKKINPAFSSTDEIYTLAFRKLDDEVNGLASSKFHSSAWTPDFTRAIRARPDFLCNEIGMGRRAVMEAHCEACNRKNHTATWEVNLTGAPYHKDTLEPIASDSSSESDNDDSDSSDSSALSSRGSETALNGGKPTYDALGERIPPESKTFTLGATCKANAQVAHTLYHWRYHLNSWVIDYLVRQKYCTPEELVKRDKMSVRKRGKLANKIVDKMEETGEIKKLHRLYRDQVNYALEAENSYKRGWGRRG